MKALKRKSEGVTHAAVDVLCTLMQVSKKIGIIIVVVGVDRINALLNLDRTRKNLILP